MTGAAAARVCVLIGAGVAAACGPPRVARVQLSTADLCRAIARVYASLPADGVNTGADSTGAWLARTAADAACLPLPARRGEGADAR